MASDLDTLITYLTANWSAATYPGVYFNTTNCVRTGFRESRASGITYSVIEIHMRSSNTAAQDALLTLINACTSFNTITARMVSSWPLGGIYHNRFEVEILS